MEEARDGGAGTIEGWRVEALDGAGGRRLVEYEGVRTQARFVDPLCECLEIEGRHVYLWYRDERLAPHRAWPCDADADGPGDPGGPTHRDASLSYRNHRGEVRDRRITVLGARWGTSPYHRTPGLLVVARDAETGKRREFAAEAFAAPGEQPAPPASLMRRYLSAATAEWKHRNGRIEDPADPHWSVGAERLLAAVDPGDATGPDPETGEPVTWPSRALRELAELGPTPREGTALLRPYAAFAGVRATNAFDLVQALTWERCDVHMPIMLDDWTPMEWGACLAGEAGEFCNKAKKAARDGAAVDEAVLGLADTVIYALLAASRLRRRLWPVIAWKVNAVSALRSSPMRIHLAADGASRTS